MHCKVPGCTKIKVGLFAKVPVCYDHQEELMDEAIMFYSKRIDERPTFESIRHMTPWKNVEKGDTHYARVESVRNDFPIAYMIRGRRYVLDHPSMRKGVR